MNTHTHARPRSNTPSGSQRCALSQVKKQPVFKTVIEKGALRVGTWLDAFGSFGNFCHLEVGHTHAHTCSLSLSLFLSQNTYDSTQ